MAIYKTPIYDRSLNDITFATAKLKEWVADKSLDRYDLKGCLNVADINRIEGNIQYVSEHLNRLGYTQEVDTKVWNISDIPTTADVTRIVRNLNALVSAYDVEESTPSVPEGMLSYTEINDIEKIIWDIEFLLDLMDLAFRKSGTFKAGSKMRLPLGRL